MWRSLLVELLGGCPTPTTRQASGGDRHLKFYEIRDNLLVLCNCSVGQLLEGTQAPTSWATCPRGARPQGPIAVLSTVLLGACRPVRSARKERPLESMPAQPHQSLSGSTPIWTCTWPRSWITPGGRVAPRRSRPRPAAMSPWSLGRTLRAGPAGRDRRHRHLRRWAGPVRARLRAGGCRGQPA
jgi:hypothetical protein